MKLFKLILLFMGVACISNMNYVEAASGRAVASPKTVYLFIFRFHGREKVQALMERLPDGKLRLPKVSMSSFEGNIRGDVESFLEKQVSGAVSVRTGIAKKLNEHLSARTSFIDGSGKEFKVAALYGMQSPLMPLPSPFAWVTYEKYLEKMNQSVLSVLTALGGEYQNKLKTEAAKIGTELKKVHELEAEISEAEISAALRLKAEEKLKRELESARGGRPKVEAKIEREPCPATPAPATPAIPAPAAAKKANKPKRGILKGARRGVQFAPGKKLEQVKVITD